MRNKSIQNTNIQTIQKSRKRWYRRAEAGGILKKGGCKPAPHQL